MTISDGTTTITALGENITEATDIEQSTAKSAGGNYKQQIAGERYTITERIRLTGTQYRALTAMIKSNPTNYIFTPTIIPDFIDAIYFPMDVVISSWKKNETVWNGQRIYYVEINIMQVSLI